MSSLIFPEFLLVHKFFRKNREAFISVNFTHELFVCVGKEIVIFDTEKVLCVLLRHTYVQKGIFDILLGQKPNLARTDSSSNTEFNSIEVQIKPPVLSKPSFFP